MTGQRESVNEQQRTEGDETDGINGAGGAWTSSGQRQDADSLAGNHPDAFQGVHSFTRQESAEDGERNNECGGESPHCGDVSLHKGKKPGI